MVRFDHVTSRSFLYLSMPAPGAVAEAFVFISARYIAKLAPLAREIKCAVRVCFLHQNVDTHALTYHPRMHSNSLLSVVVEAWPLHAAPSSADQH